jgi:hypothetical protein
MNKVMILGGYGHFGVKIAEALIKDNIPVIIVGRSKDKLTETLHRLEQKYPKAYIGGYCFDIYRNLDKKLKDLKPTIVIHTCGPFQDQDYSIARTCIENHAHYLDISDGRDYVRDISTLNELALRNNVVVISGASSVPGLTSAVIEEYKHSFSQLDHLKFGISSGQQTPGGVATTNDILTYAGKEIPSYIGAKGKVIGWQGLHRVSLPECGKRWQSNCSIPDLDLFPQYYGFKSIEFFGGVESGFLHLSLWCMSWLVRWGVPIKLGAYSNLFYRVSKAFDRFGSDAGGLYVFLDGTDLQNKEKNIKWYIIAKKNHGLFIPTIPSIVLAKKIFHGEYNTPGAKPCVGLVTLKELLLEMHDYDISVFN